MVQNNRVVFRSSVAVGAGTGARWFGFRFESGGYESRNGEVTAFDCAVSPNRFVDLAESSDKRSGHNITAMGSFDPKRDVMVGWAERAGFSKGQRLENL